MSTIRINAKIAALQQVLFPNHAEERSPSKVKRLQYRLTGKNCAHTPYSKTQMIRFPDKGSFKYQLLRNNPIFPIQLCLQNKIGYRVLRNIFSKIE